MSLRNLCLLTASVVPLCAQQPQPVYRVTIVQRTTPAINYTHRSEPTKIDFKGTALLPSARGEATVENKRGATLVDARFNHVPPPGRFGPQYLTYVVWSISPEGRAQSIGELILNGSDKGHLVASTPMQTFALIVTAEPYYSVTQPSDVVVMENAIRPETVGEVQPVNATYELLPRKEYTYNVSSQPVTAATPAVNMPEYEALLASYEARNAIDLASAAGAGRYAPDKLSRADRLYNQARLLPRKTQSEQVVAEMREAAQVAEDARAISVARDAQEQMARVQAETTQAQKQAIAERAAEQAAAERANAEAAIARQQAARAAAEAEQARQQAQARQMQARQNAATQTEADRLRPRPPENARETRSALRQRLSRSGFQTLDTPRGLVVVIPNSLVESAAEAVRGRLASVASAVAAYPGLRVEVEGNTDNSHSASASRVLSDELATRVRDMLVPAGIAASSISAVGYGGSRPTASNQTAAGRELNRRVEIVVSGDAIGTMPAWERTYSLERRPLPR